MAIERGDHDERQARIDALVEELRATEQRRLVERRIAHWNRAEAAQRAMRWITLPPPEKIH